MNDAIEKIIIGSAIAFVTVLLNAIRGYFKDIDLKLVKLDLISLELAKMSANFDSLRKDLKESDELARRTKQEVEAVWTVIPRAFERTSDRLKALKEET